MRLYIGIIMPFLYENNENDKMKNGAINADK